MPTTPLHALRYPLSTDPADVVSDLTKLATDVDNALGSLPAGGGPAGILSGEAQVWNGTAWVRSTVTKLGISSLAGYPNDSTKQLAGDGSWQRGMQLIWDSLDAGVTLPAGAITTPTLAAVANKTLMIVCSARAVGVSNTLTQLNMRINGDTSVNYWWQLLQAHGTTIAALEGPTNGDTSVPIGLLPQGTGGDFGSSTVWIPSSASNTAYHAIGQGNWATTAGSSWIGTYGGLYINAPVSTITFYDNGGHNIAAGSRFTIWGIAQ